MSFEDYKLVVYRNQPDGWLAEIPAITGCHALMPTAEEAVAELVEVFRLIEEEYRASCQTLPRDTTEIAHSGLPHSRPPARHRQARFSKCAPDRKP